MQRRTRDLLPDEPPAVVDEREGFSAEQQARLMGELRSATNAIALAYRRRDELLLHVAHGGALSRRDIGRASGMAESRVNQIARDLDVDEERDRDPAIAVLVDALLADEARPATPPVTG